MSPFMEAKVSTDAPMPEFSVGMEIPYDLRFLDLVLDSMAGFVGLAGCVRKESEALRLALDESLGFLIRSYTDAEAWERIHVEFRLQADAVAEIVITNAGPPVHLDRIPQHNPDAPEESDLDGLWYFLARKAVDDLLFENRGQGGWRIVIRKRLSGASVTKKSPVANPEVMPTRKIFFTTRLAVPEDAAALVDLTYDTYRYSYPSEDFYYVPKLQQALENREIISIVVEADGVLVGNSSLVHSNQTPRCAYSCSLMVKRSFRQSRAIIHLLKAVEVYISNMSLDVDLYYAAAVTMHTGSQKAGVKLGFSPLALLLAICSEVDFRGMKVSSDERLSLLLCVCLTSSPKLPVVYLPVRHHAVMAPLLIQTGFDCRLSGEEAALVGEHSTFTVKEDVGEGSAYLVPTRMGHDFAVRMQKLIFGLKAKGIQAVIILIPAWHPIPPDLDREMGRINAFFTGIKPVSAHECYLVYCTPSGSVDFDCIRLMDPLAENLKEHCRLLYEEVFGENLE